MKYISDFDGEVFETECECLEYENIIKKKLDEEIRQREELEIKRQNRVLEIIKKHEELQELVSKFYKDYNIIDTVYFMPTYELMNILL